MPSRKPLRKISNNTRSASGVSTPKKRTGDRQKTARKPRRAKPTEGTQVEVNGSVENQFTQNPEIPDTFVPLQHRFDPHEGRSNIEKPKEGVATTRYRLFEHFWDDRVFSILVENTNQYAATIRGPDPPPGLLFTRPWKPVTLPEMKCFIAQVVLMGVYRCRNLVEFWRRLDFVGKREIWKGLGLVRFQQIKRYLHIEPVYIEPRPSTEWWKKVEPLHTLLRERFQKALRPGSNLAIDEMMVRFSGRSKHTYRMPNKPISEGYRILALCWQGYTINWFYTSRATGIAEQIQYTGPIHLTPTSAAIYQLLQVLPYQTCQFNIFMDNFFSNISLFQVLRSLNIGACGTARQNKNAFPPDLHNSYPGLPWNHLCGAQVGSVRYPVLALQWEDSGSVHLLTTIHEITAYINRERKKPRSTSTNAATTRRVFAAGQDRQVFPIPAAVDDYNNNMNGVDIADQLRSSYPTQLKALRNWLPLFFWLLDTSIVNSFILYRLEKPNASHRTFRIELATHLYTCCKKSTPLPRVRRTYKRKTQVPYASKYDQNLPPVTPGSNHELIHLPPGKRPSCVFCRFTKRQRHQTRFACSICSLPFCKLNCFDAFHSQ